MICFCQEYHRRIERSRSFDADAITFLVGCAYKRTCDKRAAHIRVYGQTHCNSEDSIWVAKATRLVSTRKRENVAANLGGLPTPGQSVGFVDPRGIPCYLHFH
jgi:hypothetical protein